MTTHRNLIIAELATALVTHLVFRTVDPVPLFKATVILLVTPSVAYLPLLFSANFNGLFLAYGVFYGTLICSIITYRVSPFHPLSGYPGPKIAKVTKIWGAWIAYGGKWHVYSQFLHEKYGPVVRIGPNELSIIQKDLIPQILGNQGMPRGPLWDGRRFGQSPTEAEQNYDSLIDIRDSKLHDSLRKSWNGAFSAGPLKDYEQLLFPLVVQLNVHLRKACLASEDGVGRVDIAKWISCFALDFVGDLAFAGSFKVMKEGDPHGLFNLMERAMYLPSMTQHIPWAAKFFRALPGINTAMMKFCEFGIQEAMKRASLEVERKDLFYHLSESSGNDGKADLETVIGNVLLAIVAGSDTTSSALSNAMYALMSHPKAYATLRQEVDRAFEEHFIVIEESTSDGGSGDRVYSDVLATLPYLNAVINETIRLWPSVPTTIQRAPPKGSGGKLLLGDLSIFIPEGTAVMVPPYALHRDPRYFSPSPNSFIPERWLGKASEAGYTTTRDAFIPFSMGPANCVGRVLAQTEMRYVLATFVRNFEMEFDEPAFDPRKWEEDLLDRFTLEKGKLRVRMRVRKHVQA